MPAACNNELVSAIASVFMRHTILLIFTVAALNFFVSMYLRLGGILSGSYLISHHSQQFLFLSYLSISAFLTNISSSSGNEQMWYVMFSAAAHVLVQPRSIMPLALPIVQAYFCCVQLFPVLSPELPLYYIFVPISCLFFNFPCP